MEGDKNKKESDSELEDGKEKGGDESSYSGSESSDYDSDDEDELKAPIELLSEFLIYVRQANWKDAHKLCKMILIYEPDNAIALQYLDVIAEKAKIEEELAEMSSSSSEDDSSDEESKGESSDDEQSEEEGESDSNEIEELSKKFKNDLVFPHKLGIWKP